MGGLETRGLLPVPPAQVGAVLGDSGAGAELEPDHEGEGGAGEVPPGGWFHAPPKGPPSGSAGAAPIAAAPWGAETGGLPYEGPVANGAPPGGAPTIGGAAPDPTSGGADPATGAEWGNPAAGGAAAGDAPTNAGALPPTIGGAPVAG